MRFEVVLPPNSDIAGFRETSPEPRGFRRRAESELTVTIWPKPWISSRGQPCLGSTWGPLSQECSPPSRSRCCCCWTKQHHFRCFRCQGPCSAPRSAATSQRGGCGQGQVGVQLEQRCAATVRTWRLKGRGGQLVSHWELVLGGRSRSVLSIMIETQHASGVMRLSKSLSNGPSRSNIAKP